MFLAKISSTYHTTNQKFSFYYSNNTTFNYTSYYYYFLNILRKMGLHIFIVHKIKNRYLKTNR